MRHPIALAALALTACSSGGDPTPAAANTAAPATSTTAEIANGASPAVATAPTGPPKPGEIKTFRDWSVGCDNGGTCTMASLGPEMGDFPPVTMRVARDGGPRGGWSVALSGNDADPAGVAIDGKRVASGGATYAGLQAEAIVAAMANGTRLGALDSAGKAMATISLAGASAALRYIDATQGRAGGVTAAVAKGPAPATQVPEAPALPAIEITAPSGKPATPTAAQVAEMRKTAGCDTEGFASEQAAETHPLGGGATMVFVPCSAGAYNVSSALFILRDGKVTPTTADVPTGFTEGDAAISPAQVVNGDIENSLITSYAKGRGLGDCGISQTLAWDGQKLRLVEQAEMRECRGNTDLIPLWRARVVRR